MTEVEEVGDMKGIADMIEVEGMIGKEDMKNDVRKETRASLHRRLHEVKLSRNIGEREN
jgi:hypothetical protein